MRRVLSRIAMVLLTAALGTAITTPPSWADAARGAAAIGPADRAADANTGPAATTASTADPTSGPAASTASSGTRPATTTANPDHGAGDRHRAVSPTARAAAVAQQRALGMQVVPKGSAPKPGAPIQPDPALALLPDPSAVDLYTAGKARAAKAKARADRRVTPNLVSPLLHDEREPIDLRGANDTDASAERLTGFGTAPGKNSRARILGSLLATPVPTVPSIPEDNGSIPLAGDLGVATSRAAAKLSGAIGDGPHGSTGDGTGDYDFYKISGIPFGAPVTFDVDTPTGNLDGILAIFKPDGGLLIYNDDGAWPDKDPLLTAPLPGSGDYYVMVGGFSTGGSFPADPNDSGSGPGFGSEGPYDLTVSIAGGDDIDVYSAELRAGDVLGASVTGGAKRLSVRYTDGQEAFGSAVDASGSYAPSSPLPGGGNAVIDFVAPKDGRYTLAVLRGVGRYDVTLEAYRPGAELDAKGTVQTIFLDFDGARVNTAIFGGPGVRQLSPLSAFLGRWGLTPDDEDALIDQVVATVAENVAEDLKVNGTNPNFAVRILNSRDHADPFGQANVTRLVVGGTIAESGIGTIGIAQSIDPGNYGHEESALVLLDLISAPAGVDYSFNSYLSPGSDRIAFVGKALGNITVHELGHLSGNWHVNQFNDIASLMDQGGNFPLMYGIGADWIGGTADDTDVDFTADQLTPTEPFGGLEDTLNRTAWAYSRGAA